LKGYREYLFLNIVAVVDLLWIVRYAEKRSNGFSNGGFILSGSQKSVFPREFPGIHYYDSAEEEAALRVIRHRSPFRYYGANFLAETDSLEKEFAQLVGRKYAQAVCSGTNGLAAALVALEVGPGQEVLVPGFMWVATIGTVVRAGAIPVLVEIDETFGMDPEDLERKITSRSSVVIPVHMCGAACDIEKIVKIANRHGLKVLEDCAQANGGRVGNRKLGAFGDIAMFSFQMNKNITAGEGGIVVTDDERLYLRANAAHDVGVPWKDGNAQADHEIVLWGAGSRMSEITAAIVRAQLPKLGKIIEAMRSSKERIKAAISDIPGMRFRKIVDPAGDTGAALIVIFDTLDMAKKFASNASEIGLPAVWMPQYGMHIYYNIKALVERRSNSPDGFPWTHPANEGLARDYGKGALPKSDELFERSVVLPVPSLMDRALEDRYIELFRRAAGA
jgi:8-amino-3,8-dideoxy-alpha-D-manno-octulosonate transaminase